MSDPIRWRSPDGGASHDARDLLRHARGPLALDAATRARNAAAISKLASSAAAPAALSTKALLKAGLASLLAVSAGTAIHRARAPREAPAHLATTRAPAAEVAPSPEGQRAAPARVDPSRVPRGEPFPKVDTLQQGSEAPAGGAVPLVSRRDTVRSPVGRAPTRHVVPSRAAAPVAPPLASPAVGGAASGLAGAHVVPAAPAVAENTLARELALLGAASAMQGNDPREALARYDQHAREFPRGQMAAEREFLAVSALHALGRDEEARARGERLIAQHPASPYASRTRRLLDALR
jgi:hypothetical protein